MRRLHLIEIHDQNWCPPAIRDAVTDYLRHVITISNAYGAIAQRLRRGVRRADTLHVVDLCSGGGGPWIGLRQQLEEENLQVCLTDRYPNIGAFRRAQSTSRNICFYPDSVDARHVPRQLEGFRTLFSSFHHFKPEEARAILRDAVRQRRGIGVFEGTPRQLHIMLLMCLTPLMALLLTPFIRPFRWSRLLWTYIIPVVPVVLLFDGIVSCLRTYTPAELHELTEEFSESGYTWEIGEKRAERSPVAITYLIGYPVEKVAAR